MVFVLNKNKEREKRRRKRQRRIADDRRGDAVLVLVLVEA